MDKFLQLKCIETLLFNGQKKSYQLVQDFVHKELVSRQVGIYKLWLYLPDVVSPPIGYYPIS